MKIVKTVAREIFDSRGWPTIQCELFLDTGHSVISSVPSGLSRSHYEAHELRDSGERLWGQGVSKAVESIEKIIAPALLNKEPNGPMMDIMLLDLDGMPDKSHIGANALLAASMAIYRAQAYSEQVELYELLAYLVGSETITMPLPQLNLINGGVHADNKLTFQEFLVIPIGAENFKSAMDLGVTVFHELKGILHKHGQRTTVGDEGGFAPFLANDEEAINCLLEAIQRSSQNNETNCVIGIDAAASQFYERSSGMYRWAGQLITTDELIALYEELINKYPIFSLEDPLAEDDWNGWKLLTNKLSDKIQVIGDDIFATNFDRIEQGIKDTVATATVIKPNQIGTVTETLQVIQLCKQHDFKMVVSHRSGETDDTFIADLAVGASTGQIKAGGCSRGERLAKYNRLLAIEDTLLRDSGGNS